MNGLDGWSDDQIAIVGCAIAFFATMGMMVFTLSFRQWWNGSKETKPRTLSVGELRQSEDSETPRKAA